MQKLQFENQILLTLWEKKPLFFWIKRDGKGMSVLTVLLCKFKLLELHATDVYI